MYCRLFDWQEFTIAARQHRGQLLSQLLDEVLPLQGGIAAEQLLQMAAMCRGEHLLGGQLNLVANQVERLCSSIWWLRRPVASGVILHKLITMLKNVASHWNSLSARCLRSLLPPFYEKCRPRSSDLFPHAAP